MKIVVGSSNPAKKEAVSNVFRRVFDGVQVIMRHVDSGVPAQPRDNDVVLGARQRAERSLTAIKNAQFGVGIESGLFNLFGVTLDIQVCSIFDGTWYTSGTSPGFTYPPRVLKEVAAGREVGHIMADLSGIPRIGHKIGAVGYLSKGLIDRTRFTELCVIMALIPRMNEDLYEL
ncbi:MAG: inosine/xanthosine triphosphatase [Halobacteriota archaeon]